MSCCLCLRCVCYSLCESLSLCTVLQAQDVQYISASANHTRPPLDLKYVDTLQESTKASPLSTAPPSPHSTDTADRILSTCVIFQEWKNRVYDHKTLHQTQQKQRPSNSKTPSLPATVSSYFRYRPNIICFPLCLKWSQFYSVRNIFSKPNKMYWTLRTLSECIKQHGDTRCISHFFRFVSISGDTGWWLKLCMGI